jgi:hypothetical protein
VALRYERARPTGEPGEAEQYQLFETSQYQYRVFVTNFSEPVAHVAWFYNQGAGAENLMSVGLEHWHASSPSGVWESWRSKA